MNCKQVAKETARVLQNYLTYQAVRTIINQLSETNPNQALWLTQYTSSHNIQEGEVYLEELMAQNKELVLRIMSVREHLAEMVLDFLPEMVMAGISQANMEHRRQLLTRLTQSQPVTSNPHPEISESEIDDSNNP